MFKPTKSQMGTSDWNSLFLDISNKTREFRKSESIMTQYEKQTVSNYIKEQREAHYNTIYRGAYYNLFTAANKWETAKMKLQSAKQSEINRFDPGRLNQEMNYFQSVVNSITHSDRSGIEADDNRLKRIAAEVKQSGDIHKIRAFAEVVETVPLHGFDQQKKFEALEIVSEAKTNLDQIRQTPEIQTATAEFETAKTDLLKEKEAFQFIGKVMDNIPPGFNIFTNSAFEQTAKRIHIDRNSGNIEILAENDVRVLGYREIVSE
jgi:hypothetical protein